MSSIAKTPPMGWNSWDCYGAAVTEDRVRSNAAYMAENLKKFGWEYVVVDIQWYEPNAKNHWYNPDAEVVMDGYGRLMPAVNRFPSAADGAGFAPLAEYVHSLGLKFGIHILRGIPRRAVRANLPIKGSLHTAAEAADIGSICEWNTDMCGLDMSREGAQEYYNSIFELYAGWGVDFVKVDDIARPYHKQEIEAVHRAIDGCGRDMVLSLSPGAAPLAEATHLTAHANMWRMTDDFWDNWDQLHKMFDYCRDWFPYVSEGHWPDCDMIPAGALRLCNEDGHETGFSHDEQLTLMSLWAMFRSPLMFGGDLPNNDAFTLSLLQNEDVIEINQASIAGREVYRRGTEIVWAANGTGGAYYVARFNVGETELRSEFDPVFLGLSEDIAARELWTGEKQKGRTIRSIIPPHGAKLYKIMVLV